MYNARWKRHRNLLIMYKNKLSISSAFCCALLFICKSSVFCKPVEISDVFDFAISHGLYDRDIGECEKLKKRNTASISEINEKSKIEKICSCINTDKNLHINDKKCLGVFLDRIVHGLGKVSYKSVINNMASYVLSQKEEGQGRQYITGFLVQEMLYNSANWEYCWSVDENYNNAVDKLQEFLKPSCNLVEGKLDSVLGKQIREFVMYLFKLSSDDGNKESIGRYEQCIYDITYDTIETYIESASPNSLGNKIDALNRLYGRQLYERVPLCAIIDDRFHQIQKYRNLDKYESLAQTRYSIWSHTLDSLIELYELKQLSYCCNIDYVIKYLNTEKKGVKETNISSFAEIMNGLLKGIDSNNFKKIFTSKIDCEFKIERIRNLFSLKVGPYCKSENPNKPAVECIYYQMRYPENPNKLRASFDYEFDYENFYKGITKQKTMKNIYKSINKNQNITVIYGIAPLDIGRAMMNEDGGTLEEYEQKLKDCEKMIDTYNAYYADEKFKKCYNDAVKKLNEKFQWNYEKLVFRYNTMCSQIASVAQNFRDEFELLKSQVNKKAKK